MRTNTSGEALMKAFNTVVLKMLENVDKARGHGAPPRPLYYGRLRPSGKKSIRGKGGGAGGL